MSNTPSFSQVFIAFLNSKPGEADELARLATLLMFERRSGQWVGGMREELETFSKRLLSETLQSDEKEIPLDIRSRIEGKWVLLATTLRNPWRLITPAERADHRVLRLLEPRVEEARLLLLGLYSFIRGIEEQSEKWWHKGTVCWFLADSNVETNHLDSALTNFLLAAIEDAWCFERSPPGNKAASAATLPAFAGLRSVAPNQAKQLLDRVVAVIRARKTWSPREPELSYLTTMCQLEYFATSRGPLPFSDKTAKAFLTAADRAATAREKGAAYELLLAYLFETTEGFQTVLNAISRDQENDLLVINRRTDIPLRCLGEFLICQCKNTANSTGAATVREFAGRLLETGCESGVLLSKKGISGDSDDPKYPQDAVSTRIKVRQREGMSILTLDGADLAAICGGAPRFDAYLSDEYVRVRFDIPREDQTKSGKKKGDTVAKRVASSKSKVAKNDASG